MTAGKNELVIASLGTTARQSVLIASYFLPPLDALLSMLVGKADQMVTTARATELYTSATAWTYLTRSSQNCWKTSSAPGFLE